MPNNTVRSLYRSKQYPGGYLVLSAKKVFIFTLISGLTGIFMGFFFATRAIQIQSRDSPRLSFLGEFCQGNPEDSRRKTSLAVSSLIEGIDNLTQSEQDEIEYQLMTFSIDVLNNSLSSELHLDASVVVASLCERSDSARKTLKQHAAELSESGALALLRSFTGDMMQFSEIADVVQAIASSSKYGNEVKKHTHRLLLGPSK